MTVNTDIRDEFTSHDIDLRRVDGGIRKAVERRLNHLGRELKAAMIDIDPHGAQHRDAREGRTQKLNAKARELISVAYQEINAMVAKDLRRIARMESRFSVQAIAEALP